VFVPWPQAQREVDRRAHEALTSPRLLRTAGFLRPAFAERVAGKFTRPATAPTRDVLRSYETLGLETAQLFAIVRRIGVRVAYVRTEGDPYAGASELCAELRERGTMTLASTAVMRRSRRSTNGAQS
jgi:hypothetical protein